MQVVVCASRCERLRMVCCTGRSCVFVGHPMLHLVAMVLLAGPLVHGM
jgi:hypothetical protein